MRPSLASQRRAEILPAIEACIREVGIGGLTTQSIADKSGYSRSHVRHYLGNKDDQIQALVDLYSDRYAGTLEEMVEAAPRHERREVVVRELFGSTWLSDSPDDDLVLDHLNAYSTGSQFGSRPLTPMYERILRVVASTLLDVLPTHKADDQARIIVSFAYGAASMVRLGIIEPDNARRHARTLLHLEPEPEVKQAQD